MLPTRTRKAQGFTLVEILIVVVILGILAAIVIPQFTSASESAKASSLTSQLQTIRSQLELYQVQHNGNYPTLAQMWGNLTAATNQDGTTTGDPDLGPYLQKAPVNPFTNTANNTVIVATGGATNADTAWHYDATTGDIFAVVPVVTAEEQGLIPDGTTAPNTYGDIVAY